MATNNYGSPHLPVIKTNILGLHTERETLSIPAKNSSQVYFGSFITDVADSGTVGTTVLGGVKPWAINADLILGFVSGFTRNGGVPLFDDANAKAVVTNAQGEIPVKVTFSATNDVTNATPDLEFLEVTPIWDGDVIEVALFGASITSVPRGTTTGSDKYGSSFALNATYPYTILESSVVAAAATMTGVQCREVLIRGQQPANPNHVYVRFTRTSLTWKGYI